MPKKIRLKLKIFRGVVQLVALYGSETFATTKAAERRLQIMEIRWTIGISLREHVPNEIIRRRFYVTPIDEKMHEKRMRWYGHVVRETVASTTYNLEVDGRRPKGQPKQWWQDSQCEVESQSSKPKIFATIGTTGEQKSSTRTPHRETTLKRIIYINNFHSEQSCFITVDHTLQATQQFLQINGNSSSCI